MIKCPFCETVLKRVQKEIKKGTWVDLEMCPHCNDEWIDEKLHDHLVDIHRV